MSDDEKQLSAQQRWYRAIRGRRQPDPWLPVTKPGEDPRPDDMRHNR